ncbi:hypothetical protein BV22DRAFT_399243 [Leucogyrophana mollusca]|uniref:Uncharacterized protein n=1 Tax=Leucogyrophana mollusca TaxID=85980 RepID=A0ACB8BJA7_9AGAM|nr:hypothetical protein BV22DRAFT_399243 [Leucogyrophana mollusca]
MSTLYYGWSVGGFYAPLFWGFFVGLALVGTTIVQGYIYYSQSNDRWTLRLLVGILICLDVATSVLMSDTIHFYFIQHYGDYVAFLTIPLSWVIENGVTALVTCISQVFFATRIYLVTRQYAIFSPYDKIVPAIIVFAAVDGLVCAVVETYYVGTLAVLSLSGPQMEITFSMAECFAVISDVLATISLCYILASARGSIPRRGSRIRSLFFFVLNRGILVTIVQIGTMISYLSQRGYLYWMPFQICKSKLYTNTLLAMLNSRGRGQSWSNTHTLHMRPTMLSAAIFDTASSNNPQNRPDVEMGVEKNEHVSDNSPATNNHIPDHETSRLTTREESASSYISQ